jgi:hypothetical protein
MNLNPDDLTKGMEKIADEIVNHCKHGKQSTSLTDDKLACGQFYGDSVKNRTQSGLHGAAAAVSILLGSGKTTHVEVAKKILKFAQEYSSEPQNTDDALNTIKQAEILAALNDLADNSAYSNDLKNRLLTKQNASNGAWCDYLDEVDKHSEVATCYAVIALHTRVTPDKLLKSKNFLWDKQLNLLSPSKASDIYAIAVRSLILYTLANCKINDSGSEYTKKDLKNNIKEIWEICRPQYKAEFEVTVEYDRNNKNQYLRLPWQIYLAHALLISEPTCFYTIGFQSYLSKLNKAANNGGYKYEHAGKYLSTRTNAILYNFLCTANKANPHKSYFYMLLDYCSEIWANTWIRAFVVFVLGFIFLKWSNEWKTLLENQNPLWGDFIGALVISALSWLYSSGKR